MSLTVESPPRKATSPVQPSGQRGRQQGAAMHHVTFPVSRLRMRKQGKLMKALPKERSKPRRDNA